jgi:ATP-dependent Clp protease ATP-binding subunit ClpC
MSEGERSFRVYFVTHHDGRKTGILMRRWDSFFERSPPTAYGEGEAEVLSLLEKQLLEREALGQDAVDRYLWSEDFHVRQVRLDVHPLHTIRKRPVVGRATIPLRVSYAYTTVQTSDDTAKGAPRAFRVMLPRFGGWIVLEDLETSAEVLRTWLSTAFLGEHPRSIYDFRAEGDEYVRVWSPDSSSRRAEETKAREEEKPPPELGRVADDLVSLLRVGKLPVVVGEFPELVEIERALMRSPLPSILLVGPAGAGKSALVRRIAQLLVERARADRARPAPHLWSTSADRIIAGMVYLGQWQERCLTLAEELAGRGEWLYVDRLAPLVRPQNDGTSIAEMFASALDAGEVSLLAECTPSELERMRRQHGALLGRFSIVRVRERTIEETLALVGPYAARKETLSIHPGALQRLVRHVEALERDQVLPGKAFRFIDWLARSQESRRTFYPLDVSIAFSTYTGIPIELVADEHAASAEDLAAKLRARVIGQDEACAACGRVLARFKAGMSDPERPCGTLLFVGPTGVGKTELAKQLARVTFGDASRLVRVDMSEFGLRGSAARLLEIGDGVTSLAQQVKKRPLSVVLLDEIEKAHPEVFDLLLGVLGEGRLTDDTGRLVDFRGTIVVMTSNLGVSERAAVGFGEEARGGEGFVRAVREHFRPELFNRIDHVLSFRPLSPADVARIVDLELDEVRARTGLVRRGLALEVSVAARARLATLGFHPTRGARPLKRVIEERVVTPIAAILAESPALRDARVAVIAEGESASAPIVVTIG